MNMVLTGGKVLTMDAFNRTAEAVAVEDGKFAAIGTIAEITNLIGPETRVVHLAGRTVIPGIIDPHNHFSMTTFDPVSVDCRVPPHGSIIGVLEAIGAAAKDAPDGQWIWGTGFDDAASTSLRDPRKLNRWEMDEVAPNNPVCIMDQSYHACYANSEALALAGIDKGTPDPLCGWIRKDDKGEPDGTLWERAMNQVHYLSMKAHLDRYGDGVADLVRRNGQRHLACGITGIGDALTMPIASEMYQMTDKQNKLPFVIRQLLGGELFYASPKQVADGKVDANDVSDKLRAGTMKIFMDPVFPSGAMIRRDSNGKVQHFGERYYTQEEVDLLVISAHKRGLQVAIHCLGTWSVEQALNAFEKAQREFPRSDPRFRLEHFTLPTHEQLKRAKALEVIPSIQPPFIYAFADLLEKTAQEAGTGVKVEPFRSMLDEGLSVSASSDYPCAPMEPLLGLYAMVTRRTRRDGRTVQADEAVTPLDGLRMYTINAAKAVFRENETGSLEVAKRADMVVLSHDPTTVNPEFIRDIEVLETYVDGELLYQRY